MLPASLLFGIELTILYAAGSYVMSRLMRISGFGGGSTVLGRMAFYLLVFPGVVFRVGSQNVFSSAIYDLFALAAGLYALPATVAAVAALTIGFWGRTSRN